MRFSHYTRCVASILLLAAGATASAADVPSIADFARHPDFQSAALSPSGQYLATTRTQNGRKILQILRLADRKPIGTFGLAGDRDVADLYWPDDEHVLFGASLRLGSLDEAALTGELTIVKIDGSNPQTVVAPQRGNLMRLEFNVRHFEVVDLLRDDPDNILVSIFDDNNSPEFSNLYRINLRTGRRSQLLQARMGSGGFVSDERQGVVRVQSGITKGDIVVMARKSEDAGWDEIYRAPRVNGSIDVKGFAADPNLLYITSGADKGIAGLYTLDLTTKATKPLFSDPTYSIGGLLYGRDRDNPIGVTWEGERTSWKFFDDKHPDAVLFQSLRKALGDVDLTFFNFSKDRSMAVVAAHGDVAPDTYYVVDLAKPGLVARLPTRPWIDPARMSPMKPIQFKARDGTEIHGYLTLPRAQGKGPLPMVVLPHGGPFGIRDQWAFDPEVQLLASRGYAVLQPNFRGSGGYGGDFRNAGYGEFGKAMQDDLTDATRWAIQQGHADKDRICIFGGSYGAYAALEAVAVEPDLYRCAIGYGGLYDLATFQEQSYSSEVRDYWKRVMVEGKAVLEQRSPAQHAQRIKAPVFLVHGEDDEICRIDQFKAMRKALKDNNKEFEELVKDHEGHGFYDETNVEEFYTRMLAFLDKHTAPRAKAQ